MKTHSILTGLVVAIAGPAFAGTAYLSNLLASPNGPVDNALFTLVPGTAQTTRVGAFSLADPIGGMAWDQASSTMYGATLAGADSGQLCTIDLTTGLATPIGPIGHASVSGLAFEPGTGILFGVTLTGEVLELDRNTGHGSLVGSASGMSLAGLTFVPDGRAIAGGGPTGRLYSIDTHTGTQALLFGAPPMSGLAFDPDDGGLYGLDNLNSMAFSINLSTGEVTHFGTFGPFIVNPKALVFTPTPSSAVVLFVGIASAGWRRRACESARAHRRSCQNAS